MLTEKNRTETEAKQYWQYQNRLRTMPGQPLVWTDAPDEYAASKEAVKNTGKIRSLWVIHVTDYEDGRFIRGNTIPGEWEEKTQEIY